VLGIHKLQAIGLLHCLWWWALDYAPDGHLDRYDPLDIAIGAEWEGDPETLLEALISCGFVDRREDGLYLHDWMEYAGRLIERRRADAERKRAARGQQDNGGVSSGSVGNVQETTIGRPGDVQRTSDGHPSDVHMDGVRTNQPTDIPTNQDKPPLTPPYEGGQDGSADAAPSGEPNDRARKSRRRAADPDSDPRVRDLVALFVDEYRSVHGQDPVVSAEGARGVKLLLRRIKNPELLAECIRAYVRDDDRWIASQGWPLRLLGTRIDALRLRIRARDSPAYRVVDPAEFRRQRLGLGGGAGGG